MYKKIIITKKKVISMKYEVIRSFNILETGRIELINKLLFSSGG